MNINVSLFSFRYLFRFRESSLTLRIRNAEDFKQAFLESKAKSRVGALTKGGEER
jgi:hypothetical protein